MKKITIFDILITLLLFLVVSLVVFYNFFYKINSNSELYIETSDAKYYYNLEGKKIIEIEGEIGKTVIEIDKGKFRFIESPCTHKDCIRVGWVSYPNYPVICLPNKVSAYIISKKENSLYDGVTQ